MIYIEIKNGEVAASTPFKDVAESAFENYITTNFEDYTPNNIKYVFDGEKIVENPDYEAELAAIERNRLDSLTLTAADVERAIYKARGMDFEDVIAQIETLNPSERTHFAQNQDFGKKMQVQGDEFGIRSDNFDNEAESDSKIRHSELVSESQEDQSLKIDLKALKIELKANNFYRGNPYVNQIGALLGFSSEELDYLFENGEFLDA